MKIFHSPATVNLSDDDITILRRPTALHEDDIPRPDPRIYHRITGNGQHIGGLFVVDQKFVEAHSIGQLLLGWARETGLDRTE